MRRLQGALAAALLLAPARPEPTQPPPAALTGLLGVLRRASPGPQAAPRWLEEAVCARAGGLGAACQAVAAAVDEEAARAALDPVLVLAVIEIESSWDPRAVSPRDARGLMQLRRPTLEREARRARLGAPDAHDPLVNVRAGIRYLGRLARIFDDPDLALVAYNAGPNRLLRHLRSREGLPERFWRYPRSVRREERRLREALGAPAAALASALTCGTAPRAGW